MILAGRPSYSSRGLDRVASMSQLSAIEKHIQTELPEDGTCFPRRPSWASSSPSPARSSSTTIAAACSARRRPHRARVKARVPLTERVAPELAADPQLAAGFRLHDIGMIGIPT